MIPTLLLLAGAAVAAALTWRFCMRPMLRGRFAPGAAKCCAPKESGVQDELRRTRAQLAELRRSDASTSIERTT